MALPEGTILVDSNSLIQKLDKSIGLLEQDAGDTASGVNRNVAAIAASAERIHAPLREHLKITHRLPVPSVRKSTKPDEVLAQIEETVAKFQDLLIRQKESGEAEELAPYHQIVDGVLKINKACAFVSGEVDKIFDEVRGIHKKLWEDQVSEIDSEITNIVRAANKVYLHLDEHLEEIHAGDDACTDEKCHVDEDVVFEFEDPFEAINVAKRILEKLHILVAAHADSHS
ncbi:MAG: hypothetical protein WBC93_01745 [Sulfitobacter sp.]